jgi:hypothetical protein
MFNHSLKIKKMINDKIKVEELLQKQQIQLDRIEAGGLGQKDVLNFDEVTITIYTAPLITLQSAPSNTLQ